MKKVARVVFILFLLMLLFYLCFDSYFHFDGKYPEIDEFLSNLGRYDGIRFERMGTVGKSMGDFFTFVTNRREVMVKTHGSIMPAEGTLAVIHGTYNSAGYLDIVDIRPVPYHYLKYIVSFIGLFVVIVFLFSEWKLTRRGLVPNA